MEQKELTVEQLREQLVKAEAKEKKQQQARKKAYKSRVNSFVESIVSEFENYQPKMQALKNFGLQEGNLLNKEMYEVYEKEPKAPKSITFKNNEDTMKVVVSHQDKFCFDETAQVHLDTIREIFKNKFSKNNKALYKALNLLLTRNKQGDWNASHVLKLRKLADDINDNNLTNAVKELMLSAQFSGTSDYVRVYKRNKEGKYMPIVISFSKL